jgi:hypothetical protein
MKFKTIITGVGQAMINAVIKGYPRPILEVKDIVQLAKG